MNYLPCKFLDAIFRVRSVPCFDDIHAQVNCFDFSISSNVNIFLLFLLAINTKCLQNFKFQAISKSKFKNGCCAQRKVQQQSKMAVKLIKKN